MQLKIHSKLLILIFYDGTVLQRLMFKICFKVNLVLLQDMCSYIFYIYSKIILDRAQCKWKKLKNVSNIRKKMTVKIMILSFFYVEDDSVVNKKNMKLLLQLNLIKIIASLLKDFGLQTLTLNKQPTKHFSLQRLLTTDNGSK